MELAPGWTSGTALDLRAQDGPRRPDRTLLLTRKLAFETRRLEDLLARLDERHRPAGPGSSVPIRPSDVGYARRLRSRILVLRLRVAVRGLLTPQG